MVIYAIQKRGRLHKPSLEYLKSLGHEFNENLNDDLILNSKDNQHKVFLVRHVDVPMFVKNGIADFGIVTKDVLVETGNLLTEVENLGFCKCMMVICVPENSDIKSPEDLNDKKIATSYPNALKKYLRKKNISAEVVEINGSVEIAFEAGLSDAICDLTCTGDTIRKYKLRIVDELYETEAFLISK